MFTSVLRTDRIGKFAVYCYRYQITNMLARDIPQKLHLCYYAKQSKPSGPDIHVSIEPHPHHVTCSLALPHVPNTQLIFSSLHNFQFKVSEIMFVALHPIRADFFNTEVRDGSNQGCLKVQNMLKQCQRSVQQEGIQISYNFSTFWEKPLVHTIPRNLPGCRFGEQWLARAKAMLENMLPVNTRG